MRALFFRNVENYKQLEEITDKARREGRKGLDCEITSQIVLDEKTFKEFLSNFNKNQQWLYPHIKDMRIENDCKWMCFCISGENCNEKILVFNNGASYPEFIAKC